MQEAKGYPANNSFTDIPMDSVPKSPPVYPDLEEGRVEEEREEVNKTTKFTRSEAPVNISLVLHLILLLISFTCFGFGLFIIINIPLPKFYFLAKCLLGIFGIIFAAFIFGTAFGGSRKRLNVILAMLLLLGCLASIIYLIIASEKKFTDASSLWHGTDEQKLATQRFFKCCGNTNALDNPIDPCPETVLPCGPFLQVVARKILTLMPALMYTIVGIDGAILLLFLIILIQGPRPLQKLRMTTINDNNSNTRVEEIV